MVKYEQTVICRDSQWSAIITLCGGAMQQNVIGDRCILSWSEYGQDRKKEERKKQNGT